MKKIFAFVTGLLAMSGLLGLNSCVDNDPMGDSYYTFTGEMVTDYLEHREGTFSEFSDVLKRAQLWDLLSTYGEFTCFAPTNDAMEDYLRIKGVKTIEELDDASCDTLAWTHIIKAAYFTTDLPEGSIPTTNMLNRYLSFSCKQVDDRAVYYMNANSEMIARDDSVVNGVVHTLARVLTASSDFIGDAIVADERCKIFGEALVITGLVDTLAIFQDERYYVSPDSCTLTNTSPHHRTFGNNDVYWKYPATRDIKWTVFVEPDSIFQLYGINNLDELKAYAKEVYDETYPEDAGKYDDDFTNRRNPLNRFVAYHILDRYASYSEMTVSASVFGSAVSEFRTEFQDIMEFYETLCPFTIMKISDNQGQKWVNRKTKQGNTKVVNVKGSRIFSPSEMGDDTNKLNGLYHYIDRPLTYNKKETIDQVLNCRMRIDASTLSPDFMNAGARNSNPATYNVNFFMTGFKPGFTKNFVFSEDTFFGVHCRFWCNSWENDMCACLDNFDIKFRIPPVPAGQTYEVRLGYVCGANRTVVQVYFEDVHDGISSGDLPCGIPVDLRKYAPEYGWVSDSDLNNDEDEIEANDKALRNQGFMKGLSGAFFADLSSLPRDQVQCLRRILTTQYIEPEHDYYIRLRQVLENQAEMSLDYIEIVPKSIYDGTIAEDRY